jgi:hypothetical protein
MRPTRRRKTRDPHSSAKTKTMTRHNSNCTRTQTAAATASEIQGYTGLAEYDEQAGVIFSHIIGLRDFITCQGESISEVIQAFSDSIDNYLEL